MPWIYRLKTNRSELYYILAEPAPGKVYLLVCMCMVTPQRPISMYDAFSIYFPCNVRFAEDSGCFYAVHKSRQPEFQWSRVWAKLMVPVR